MPEFDFGPYHVEGELGRGGMAMVYKAIDRRSDTIVALKILYPHMMTDDSSVKRFQREAKVASRLKHPHIVPVIDFGEQDEQIYIAMKYMQGNSLAKMFEIPRSVKIKSTVRLLGQIAGALDYAHQYGVIHRDLKLQNILMDEKNQAYLADFGIARLVDGTRLTATGQIAGTPMYMSPEQIRGKAVDHRSDIYSFTVMAYLMLTGFYPFTGEDSLAIVHKHVKEIPPTPTEVNPFLPEGLNAILLRGLLMDPEDRYTTASDMIKAMAEIVDDPAIHQTSTQIRIDALNPVDSIEMTAPGQEISKIQAPVMTSTATMAPSGSNRGIYVMMALIVILILIVGGIALVALSGSRNQDDNSSELAANAVTQAMLALTSTHNAEVVLQVEQTQTTTARVALRATLPPTWTPTVLPTATITPTISDRPLDASPNADDTTPALNGNYPASNADAIVSAPNNARLQERPGPNQKLITLLDQGTELSVIGRTEDKRALQVVTPAGVEGWMDAVLLTVNVDIDKLPMTWSPANNPPPPRNNGNNGNPGNNGN